MRLVLLLSFGVLAVSGCQESSTNKATNKTTTVTDKGDKKTTTTTTVEKTPADNSAVNERDRSGTTKTPIDQNENQSDINKTADIRKRVMAEKDFSVAAQNVKIITADGKVTLRGPVKTQHELDTIVKIAHELAGKDNVDNKLELAQ